ncbi:YbaB/EbfC family nucleoid-associated protein [Micromonospora sp. SL1-18]|uniref:YbaB/EbfC family nucleoid-associated protein n=1 Tax=Micromonospora sp. SL1-18 TaxID=3399128 RepID=UPI003A4D2A2A
MPDDAGDDYAARISAYRRELAEMRIDRSGSEAGAESRGDAAEGQVNVVAAAGRLRSVELAGRLMRLPGEDLGPLIVEAANTALAGARSDLVNPEPAPDLSGLTDSFAAALAESELALHRVQGALNEAIAKVGPRTGLGGDLPETEASDLLYGVMDTLRSVRGVPPDQDQPDAAERRGVGSDGAGHISVEVDGTGQIVRLALPRAGRLTSDQLGELIVEAVNRALDEVEPAPAVDAVPPGLAGEDLGRRVAELQEASVRQMTALTGALTGIMARIREP